MRRRMRIGVGLAVAVVAVVAGLLIGRPGKSDLAVAGERMHAQNMRGTFLIKGSTDGQSFTYTGRMAQAADGTRATMTGIVTQPSAPPMAVAMVIVRDDLFMRFPHAPRITPPGKRWVHMVDHAKAPQSLTPSQFARLLADADEVDTVGHERVQGLDTTHLRGRISARELVDEIGGATERAYDRRFGHLNPKIPIEAWVARDGLPRRLHLHMGMGDASTDIVLQIARYGVDVHAQPPPGAQVVEEDDWEAYTRSLGQSS